MKPPIDLAARALLALSTAFAAGAAQAQQTVPLPAAACSDDTLFVDAFDEAGAEPSGNVQRTVAVPGGGNRIYYAYVPGGYRSSRATPVVVALHGAAGTPSAAVAAAQSVRDAWSSVAESGDFIVVAPVAGGASGGWVPGVDDRAIAAQLEDARSAFAIDATRRYLWGFSAGAHFGHGHVLDDASVYAAYGVSAGTLVAYACTAAGCPAYLASVSRRPPVDIHVGAFDTLQPHAAADLGRFTAAGWVPDSEVRYSEFAGGHTYAVAHLDAVWSFACRFAVRP